MSREDVERLLARRLSSSCATGDGAVKVAQRVEMQMAHVVTFRGGKAIRFRQFLDRTKALEAAGLSEQGAHADS